MPPRPALRRPAVRERRGRGGNRPLDKLKMKVKYGGVEGELGGEVMELTVDAVGLDVSGTTPFSDTLEGQPWEGRRKVILLPNGGSRGAPSPGRRDRLPYRSDGAEWRRPRWVDQELPGRGSRSSRSRRECRPEDKSAVEKMEKPVEVPFRKLEPVHACAPGVM